ncbi:MULTISPECIES: dTMP kinase [unclassified Thalassotalea]|uniref:dTMP kinase n=1 Tax=unclassified Thalassotalea TaxID=2614972 RepID=UPI00107FF77F|nr:MULTISPECIES: dTMP kinase [unclassified Thalassotalea]NMP15557.1 dTMP kinase [Thalassotalea sp. Y01]QBY05798.1 dTMP kinase [Thalassotalea sp. HSM 43]
MSQGKFIVVEGIEGAGKSSAIAVIEDVLKAKHIEYVKTREPGGTPLAEKLRALVKEPSDETVTKECELLLMYASRSQLLANKILPALAQGKWVIGDRHDLSSRAYQGGGREFNDTLIDTIANITLGDFKPDLTLYLDIEPELGLQRAQNRGELDRIEQEKIDFFHRVRNKYLQLATLDDNTFIVDASQSMDKVHQDIRQTLENQLP